jgi:hypothetical protein
MPRNRLSIGNVRASPTHLKAASDLIFSGKSKRAAAKQFELSHTTLMRYHKKRLADPSGNPKCMNYGEHSRVFTDEQELKLQEYILEAAEKYSGLTKQELRKFAYDLAIHYGIKCPPNWVKSECAGEDWCYGFMKRHPILSIRAPQATSLARASAFSRHNVKLFFENYDPLLKKYKFGPEAIWEIQLLHVRNKRNPTKKPNQRNPNQRNPKEFQSKKILTMMMKMGAQCVEGYSVNQKVVNLGLNAPIAKFGSMKNVLN